MKSRIILASGSPRRQEYMQMLGFPFQIEIASVEEVYPSHLKAEEITNYLAILKATPFQNKIQEGEIVITCDTIVWLDNQALGKPKNTEDAFFMLKRLSGNTHEVITSVCITTQDNQDVFHEKTKVTFISLTDEEINYYINEFKPFDKAGAYGIQEWIGIVGIDKIEGSYANVVGLPVALVYQKLKKYF